MGKELGYGQPMGGIAQTAFIVPDLNEAMQHYARDCGAGPFFVLPNFLQPGQVYRGSPSTADWNEASAWLSDPFFIQYRP